METLDKTLVKHGLAWLTTSATLALAQPVAAQTQEECAAAYPQAQRLRQAKRLVSAKQKLLTCAQEACSETVQRDCSLWLDEVREEIPTVAVRAHDSRGRDLIEVDIHVDGRLVRSIADGKAFELDPGEHRFEFEFAGEKIERRIVVLEGEKARSITVEFGSNAPAPSRAPKAKGDGAGLPLGTWIFAGIGLAALGTSAYFAIDGQQRENDLQSSPCAESRTCPTTEVDRIGTSYLVADIAAGIGLASTAVAFIWWIRHPGGAPSAGSAASPRSTLDFRLRTGGASAATVWLTRDF